MTSSSTYWLVRERILPVRERIARLGEHKRFPLKEKNSNPEPRS